MTMSASLARASLPNANLTVSILVKSLIVLRLQAVSLIWQTPLSAVLADSNGTSL